MNSRSEIAAQILSILEKSKGLKASELSSKISTKLGRTILKKEVNSILYSTIKNQVYQDTKYKWHIKSSVKKTQKTSTLNFKDTDLTKISSYYLECLASELDGVSLFAKSKFNLDYCHVEELDPNVVPASEDFFKDKKKCYIKKV